MATPIHVSFSDTIAKDFLKAVCKDRLGDGMFREVWVWDPNPEWVVKFETAGEEFQNIIEWKVWDAAPAWLRRWLAPCVRISPFGTVLWQCRCAPIDDAKIPTKIPKILQDYHKGNWGIYEKRPVLFDYGFLYNFVQSAPKDLKEIVFSDDSDPRTVRKKKV